ncbi:hypothetical protein EBU95_02045 [bacterium]|nr:hypothetical protein [bacterium]
MTLADYINTKYPGLLKKVDSESPIGFILNKASVGVMNGKGEIQTIGDVNEVEMMLKQDFSEIVSKIPLVKRLDTDTQNMVVLNAEKIPKELGDKIINNLLTQLHSGERNAAFISSDQPMNPLVVNASDSEKTLQLVNRYNQLKACVDSLMSQKEVVIARIRQYNEQMEKYIKSNTANYNTIYKNIKAENEALRIQLEKVLEAPIGGEEITGTIEEIKAELAKSRDLFRQTQIKAMALQAHQQQCAQTVLQQKEEIIKRIAQYNERYSNWAAKLQSDTQAYKAKLLQESKEAIRLLESAKTDTGLGEKEAQQLRQSVSDIKKQLAKTVSDNLIQLNLKEQEIVRLRDLSKTESVNYQSQIAQLQKELSQVKLLLSQNDQTSIGSQIDFTNCHEIVKAFCALNNVFYRKQEVIKKLDSILADPENSFTNLAEATKENIKAEFEKVKLGINQHIDFMDLKRYINDARCRQNLEFFKNELTRNKVPKSFCDELSSLVTYWDTNKLEFREQDRILTNIYEDLSGAVRVYVRIKPLLGLDQRNRTVTIETPLKKVKLICGGRQESYGEFYGVFDQSFSNMDVYTGIENSESVLESPINVDAIVESQDTVSPGLYSTIRQVEDGYSVVIFGYGASGAGKTMTLVGNGKIPGLLHYARSNLRGVTSFRLRYMFEQYHSLVNFNFRKVAGKIHTLVGTIPRLDRAFIADETSQFSTEIARLNLDNLVYQDLFTLTRITDNYRKQKMRIAKTPNNPESSRSHLYMVFEVTFETGKTGYITFVDTAGRESPVDIFNTFIDSSKSSLESIMAPSGGEQLIEKSKKEDLDRVYNAAHILSVLKGGFYINETINHLVYYFNKKNYKQTNITMQSENESYSPLKYFVDPRKETSKISAANNSLMIPILKFLDNLSNKNKNDSDFRPTKFVTIVNLRQEEKYCDQTFESMEFANAIKST